MSDSSIEGKYEGLLIRNYIISSSAQQLSCRQLDAKGRRECFLVLCFVLIRWLLMVVHASAILMTERLAQIVREYSGDYLSFMGIAGIGFNVFLMIGCFNTCIDKVSNWKTEKRGFPAVQLILSFRRHLSTDSCIAFEKLLANVVKLEPIANLMFVYPTFGLHAAITAYCLWVSPVNTAMTITAKILSCLALVIMGKFVVMTFIASWTLLVLASNLMTLKINDVVVSIRDVDSRPMARRVMNDMEDVRIMLNRLQLDVGWILKNSLMVLMPATGLVLSGGIAFTDPLIRLYIASITGPLLLIYFVCVSTAANVFNEFRRLAGALISKQASEYFSFHDRLRMNRFVKDIACSERPLCFSVGKTFPFTSASLGNSLSFIVSFVLLLIPALTSLQQDRGVKLSTENP